MPSLSNTEYTIVLLGRDGREGERDGGGWDGREGRTEGDMRSNHFPNQPTNARRLVSRHVVCLFPVHYLTYGPFSSYGPMYDSSAANLTKEESDLLLSTYGDETGAQYAKRYLVYSCVFTVTNLVFVTHVLLSPTNSQPKMRLTNVFFSQKAGSIINVRFSSQIFNLFLSKNKGLYRYATTSSKHNTQ